MNQDTVKLDNQRMGIALLIVRLAAAMTFLYHGSSILFGAFGGPGVTSFAEHTHLPLIIAVLVGIGQFGGGLAMLTGILTRLGAAGIAVIMLGAIVTVHLKNGFDITKGGVEYALTQFLIALGILISGAGPYSLMSLIRPAKSTSEKR